MRMILANGSAGNCSLGGNRSGNYRKTLIGWQRAGAPTMIPNERGPAWVGLFLAAIPGFVAGFAASVFF